MALPWLGVESKRRSDWVQSHGQGVALVELPWMIVKGEAVSCEFAAWVAVSDWN